MGSKKVKDWRYKKKEPKTYDPGLLAAIEVANYRMNVRKQAAKVLEQDQTVQRYAEQYKDEVEDEFTDWLFGCFALVMHRKYKFGAKRIARLFDEMQEMRKELVANGMHSKEIWDVIRDEIRLDIVTE